MLKRLLIAAGLWLLASPAFALNCPSFPYTLTNGSTADANQVMANFNNLLNCSNLYLAHNGTNSDITAMTALTTLPSAAIISGLGYTPANLAATVTSNAEPLFVYPVVDGNRFEVQRAASPVNYAGTRAADVFQESDAESLGLNGVAQGHIFDCTSTGNGTITSGPVSNSFWNCLQITAIKSGDGSEQPIGVIGQLGAVGVGGYNEMGGYIGLLQNIGSTNGYMSGYELLIEDGGFDTRINNVASRISRTVAGSNYDTNFVASSEGSQPLDSVFEILKNGYQHWKVGFDLTGGTFTGGAVFESPNQTCFAWVPSGGGSPVCALTVGSLNITALTPVTSGGQACFEDFSGVRVACQANDNFQIPNGLLQAQDGATVAGGLTVSSGGLAVTGGYTGLPVASTSTAGISAYATGSQVIAGTSTTTAVTPASLVSNCAPASGYCQQAGGLIEEWGSTISIASNSSAAVTLPLACPTAVGQVQITAKFAGSGSQAHDWVGSVSTTAFTVNNASGANGAFYWHLTCY